MLRLLAVLLVLPSAAGLRTPNGGDVSLAVPATFQVKRNISLTIGHALGAAEAKRRATERFAQLQEKFAGQASESSMLWSGDVADVRVVAYGQLTTAKVVARETALEIHVVLPPALAPLGGSIQSFLNRTAIDTLKP